MNKDYIPYEQAFELRKIGYDDECTMYYAPGHPEGFYLVDATPLTNSHWLFTADDQERRKVMCTAPLYQQAFRWFREEHGWVGGIRKLSSMGNNKIVGEFYKDDDNSFIMFGETYEECELRALKYLIELFKNK